MAKSKTMSRSYISIYRGVFMIRDLQGLSGKRYGGWLCSFTFAVVLLLGGLLGSVESVLADELPAESKQLSFGECVDASGFSPCLDKSINDVMAPVTAHNIVD